MIYESRRIGLNASITSCRRNLVSRATTARAENSPLLLTSKECRHRALTPVFEVPQQRLGTAHADSPLLSRQDCSVCCRCQGEDGTNIAACSILGCPQRGRLIRPARAGR